MWKRELILKAGSTNDRTAILDEEGKPNLCQQPGLKTSRRPNVEMNSPNLGRRGT